MKRKALSLTSVLLLILIAAALMTSCEPGGGEDNEGSTAVTTATPGSDSGTQPATEASLAVSADPVTAASRGLSFTDNGDGSCTLTGIGSCTDSCILVPDTSDSGVPVTKIAPSAFEGNSFITAVRISSGITDIGAGAFASCPYLAFISVEDGNKSYIDLGGILYTADGSELVCMPAGATYNTLTVTLQLKKVADKATAGCVGIKKVLFEGSESEWRKITLGADNSVLTAAVLTCMKQSGK